MYLPEQFKETSPERIAAIIESHSFGMLVTTLEGAPFVSHLPFIFDQFAGLKGRLFCHMARANPQWQHLSTAGEALVVFQGPHAYVSPSWYSSPGVPTWNYAVAHLRGKPGIIESESELESLLERMTSVYESNMPNPWVPELAGGMRAKLLNAIVGIEIEVADIQAKFKISQNRPLEDQRSVIEHLARSGNQLDAAMGNLMKEILHADF